MLNKLLLAALFLCSDLALAFTQNVGWSFTWPANGGTANYVMVTSGGTTAATGTWGQVNLTTAVTGLLPLANGGCNKALPITPGGVVWIDANSCEVTSAGTSGQVLTSNGTAAPTWTTPSASSPGGGDGAVQYNNGGSFGGDAVRLTWDDVNFRFGVGTATPAAKFRVVGSADEIQARVTGFSGQTTNLLQVETSAPATKFAIKSNGAIDASGAGLQTYNDSLAIPQTSFMRWPSLSLSAGQNLLFWEIPAGASADAAGEWIADIRATHLVPTVSLTDSVETNITGFSWTGSVASADPLVYWDTMGFANGAGTAFIPSAAVRVGATSTVDPTPLEIMRFQKGVAGVVGNVGINQPAPAERLDVIGNIKASDGTDFGMFDFAAGIPRMHLANDGTADSYVTAAADGSLALSNSNGRVKSENFFYTDNFGLGSLATGASASQTLGPGTLNLWGPAAGPAFLSFSETGVANRGTIGFLGGSGDLLFKMNNEDIAAGNERMRLTNAGFLGIGLTPTEQLEISGSFKLPESSGSDGFIKVGALPYWVAHTGSGPNFFLGPGSGNTYVTGSDNWGLGGSALAGVTTGINNIGIGTAPFPNLTSGQNNIGIGYETGLNATTQSHNIAMGFEALSGFDTAEAPGSENITIGAYSGARLSANIGNARRNVLIGHETVPGAPGNPMSTEGTVAVGYQAGNATGSAGFNTFVGYRAGATNSTGGSNTAIGANADIAVNVTNATAIGANAVASTSNQIVMGDGNAGVSIPDTGGNGGNVPHGYNRVIGTTAVADDSCSAVCPANSIAVSGECTNTVSTVALNSFTASTTSTLDDTFNCTYVNATGDCTAVAKCFQY